VLEIILLRSAESPQVQLTYKRVGTQNDNLSPVEHPQPCVQCKPTAQCPGYQPGTKKQVRGGVSLAKEQLARGKELSETPSDKPRSEKQQENDVPLRRDRDLEPFGSVTTR
jgi:hypothetical protein